VRSLSWYLLFAFSAILAADRWDLNWLELVGAVVLAAFALGFLDALAGGVGGALRKGWREGWREDEEEEEPE
jgi:hypothetical protein